MPIMIGLPTQPPFTFETGETKLKKGMIYLTVLFAGIDHDEAVIASDTRLRHPDDRISDDFINPKIYRFGPRLLALFAGQVGAINRLVNLLGTMEDLTPKRVVDVMVKHCQYSKGEERLNSVVLGDENKEFVVYGVDGHHYTENGVFDAPYIISRHTGENRPIHLFTPEKTAKLIYQEYLTGIPLKNLAIKAVQIMGELHPETYSKFPEVWVLPREGPAYCYTSTHQPLHKATCPIYGNGFQLDKDGIYGYSGGIKHIEIKPDGRWYAAGGNIIADYDGMRFIGKLGPDKPMIEFKRETGEGKFRGEVAGSIVAWDTQMPEVTTEAFRQVNCSEKCKATGPSKQEQGAWLQGYSQVNASYLCEASGILSQLNASQQSTASGIHSQVNASWESEASGRESQVNASWGSIAQETRSQVNASQVSMANGIRSQVNASWNSEANGANSQVNVSYHGTASGNYSQVNGGQHSIASGFFSQVNASLSVTNNIEYSMAGGYGSVPASTANRKWHIFSNPSINPTIQIATTLQSNHTFGDYGEYFESIDGQEIPTGYIVTLEGDKIRKATSEDKRYLGTISKTAGIILGGAGFCWQGRFLRGEFGEISTQEVPDPLWKPKDGQTEEDRPLVTVEVENPDYDPEREYFERAKRPEWHIVGLLGQVHVRIDSSVQAGGYIKSNDEGIGTEDELEQGWYVMKVTTPYNEAKGYGVALCLVK